MRNDLNEKKEIIESQRDPQRTIDSLIKENVRLKLKIDDLVIEKERETRIAETRMGGEAVSIQRRNL